MVLVITGAPGSGKSTLATRLAAELELPLVAKDDVKEALFEVLGTPPDRPGSQRVGRAAIGVMLAIAVRSSQAGADLILECNFRRGQAEADLLPLLAITQLRLIHCFVPYDLTLERYGSRPDRHPGHHDDQAIGDLVRGLQNGEFDPLELPAPLLVVDTSDGYRPRFEEIAAFCR